MPARARPRAYAAGMAACRTPMAAGQRAEVTEAAAEPRGSLACDPEWAEYLRWLACTPAAAYTSNS
jgi:hypothetical protein